jgi:hypothetical protein
MMDTRQIRNLVEFQIGDEWSTTNHHGVDLRKSLVKPQKVTVIERFVRDGIVSDQLVEVWLVLIEEHDKRTGYRIVCKDDEPIFGLASEGFPHDKHSVMCGWYGDFMTAFLAM